MHRTSVLSLNYSVIKIGLEPFHLKFCQAKKHMSKLKPLTLAASHQTIDQMMEDEGTMLSCIVYWFEGDIIQTSFAV